MSRGRARNVMFFNSSLYEIDHFGLPYSMSSGSLVAGLRGHIFGDNALSRPMPRIGVQSSSNYISSFRYPAGHCSRGCEGSTDAPLSRSLVAVRTCKTREHGVQRMALVIVKVVKRVRLGAVMTV